MMVTREMFKNSTVKEVAFEVKFPNLFFIETKIPDYQMKIMDTFIESNLLIRQQIAILKDIGSNIEKENASDSNENVFEKIWQFKTEDGTVLNIKSNSLSIISPNYKTYNLGTTGENFRDLIKFTVDNLLNIVPISMFTRIGFRYINECPIFKLTKEDFEKSYNTAFPLSKFSIMDATEMDFKAVVKKDGSFLRYVESLQTSSDDKKVLIIDTDGFKENIKTTDYLQTTDKLHDILYTEFVNTVKEPVLRYMRGAE